MSQEELDELADMLEELKDKVYDVTRAQELHQSEERIILRNLEYRLRDFEQRLMADVNGHLQQHKEQLLNRYSTLQAERDQLQRTSEQLATTLTGTKDLVQHYKQERDDVYAAMQRYNPEVTNRQEELYDTAEIAVRYTPARDLYANKPGNVRDNVRQELAYFAPLKPPKKSDGNVKLREFRTWLTGRAIIPEAMEGAAGQAVVSNANTPLTFNVTEARLCQDPAIVIRNCDRLFWCTLPEHHGLLVCPESQYGPNSFYSGDTWSKVTEWRACAEQKREVFYERDGRIQYAGTYICHSGPSGLQLKELGKLKSEILVRALAKETRKAKKQKKAERELVTIEQLYREGSITVHVLGLEKIGFNGALYESLAARYNRTQRVLPVPPLPATPSVAQYAPAQVPVAAIIAPHAPYYAAAPPVAGPSRTPHVAPLAAPAASTSGLVPPPSYIANIPINPKRAREDTDLDHPAKYARFAAPIPYGDDEGYLFHLGSNYYKDLLEDGGATYDDDDAVSLGRGYSDFEFDDEE